jgi:CBS domain-containing protein
MGTEVEKALGVAPPETVSIDPERPLYEACRRMLESRARRIPLVTNDSQTDRSHVLSVITQYRILKFVAVNVSDTQKLRRPLGELLLGTYDNIATASMDTPVIDVIHILVERSISSVPILNSEGMLTDLFFFSACFLSWADFMNGLIDIPSTRCRIQCLRVGRCDCPDSRWCL